MSHLTACPSCTFQYSLIHFNCVSSHSFSLDSPVLSTPSFSLLCLISQFQLLFLFILSHSFSLASPVEPLLNCDHPHQRPSLLYDRISCDGQCFLFVRSLTDDHPSNATSDRVRLNFLPRGRPHRVFQNDCGMNVQYRAAHFTYHFILKRTQKYFVSCAKVVDDASR